MVIITCKTLLLLIACKITKKRRNRQIFFNISVNKVNFHDVYLAFSFRSHAKTSLHMPPRMGFHAKRTCLRRNVNGAQRKAKQLERPLAFPQQQGCGEKGGDKWGPGHAGAGKKPRFFRWQRTGTILAAPAANNGSGRENQWQRPLTSLLRTGGSCAQIGRLLYHCKCIVHRSQEREAFSMLMSR